MAVTTLPELDAEYRELREGAGLLERPGRGSLDVRGPDGAAFLQGQVTNDVAALAPGEGCYAAMLNPKGRIVADMRILRTADDYVVDTEPGAHDAVARDLRMYKIGRQVEIADRTGERTLLSLIGPRAAELAGTGAALGAEDSSAAAWIAGLPVLAIATDTGVDLLVESADAPAVRDALVAGGARPVREEAVEIVRIESGRPLHGRDMTADNLPAEAGIVERAVSFTKGCYVGQEPVARMHYKGHPNRHLRGLELARAVAPGTALQAGDREVGTVSSTCVSPALGPIALALVRREVAPGEHVEAGPGGPRATVVELPFRRT